MNAAAIVVVHARTNLRRCLTAFGLCAAVLPGSPSAAVANAGLPIKAGDYATEGTTCSDAPLAGLMHYEHGNFSGPHESSCTSVVQRRQGRTFKVATTCRALGDGTPTPPAKVVESYKVLSVDRVIKLASGPSVAAITYQHCAHPAH